MVSGLPAVSEYVDEGVMDFGWELRRFEIDYWKLPTLLIPYDFEYAKNS